MNRSDFASLDGCEGSASGVSAGAVMAVEAHLPPGSYGSPTSVGSEHRKEVIPRRTAGPAGSFRSGRLRADLRREAFPPPPGSMLQTIDRLPRAPDVSWRSTHGRAGRGTFSNASADRGGADPEPPRSPERGARHLFGLIDHTGRREARLPRGTSPQKGERLPKKGNVSSEEGGISPPRRGTSLPKRGTSQQGGECLPQEGERSPQRLERSSRQLERSTKQLGHYPRRLERSTKRLERCPQQLGHSPKRLRRSPNRLEHFPSLLRQSPTVWNRVPLLWTVPPGFWEIPPPENATPFQGETFPTTVWLFPLASRRRGAGEVPGTYSPVLQSRSDAFFVGAALCGRPGWGARSDREFPPPRAATQGRPYRIQHSRVLAWRRSPAPVPWRPLRGTPPSIRPDATCSRGRSSQRDRPG